MSDEIKWFVKLPIRLLGVPGFLAGFVLLALLLAFSSLIGIFAWAFSDSTEFFEMGWEMFTDYCRGIMSLFKYPK
jgi:hypothetical protein